MVRVGIRALKARLSEYVARARSGEQVIVTDRGKDVAEIVALGQSDAQRAIAGLVASGMVRWGGKRLEPVPRIPIAGGPIADTILEDRR